MLVLTRKFQQQIKIGDGITVTILRVKGQTVRVGIDAPRDVRVIRGELPRDGQAAEDAAAQTIVVEADEDDVEASAESSRLAAASTPAAPRLPQRKRFNRTTSPPLRLAMASVSLAK